MSKYLEELFEDKQLAIKIKQKLPYLFQLAELESSRAGKVGMEVGSVREKIITSLLIYRFGKENIQTEIPITKSEEDLLLFGNPVSIKTITCKNLTGVKLIWTVDSIKANDFLEKYTPYCDMLLIQVNWNNVGGFFYFSLNSQKKVFNKIGRERYIKLPKKGTNPRGVEISKEALTNLIQDDKSKRIDIFWEKKKIEYNPYKKWIDLWMES